MRMLPHILLAILFVPLLILVSPIDKGLAQTDANACVVLASDSPIGISDVVVNLTTVARYDKFEITFQVGGVWENPYNPDEVQVDAVFSGPQGEQYRIPAFYYQEYRKSVSNGRESYSQVGAPCWKVRFAPPETGSYQYSLIVVNKGQTFRSEARSFTCTSNSNTHGYLRISSRNPLYFEYEDGTPYFAVAMDKASGNISQFEHLYENFSRAGGNFNRLFLTHGTFNISERMYRPLRADQGVGKLNLDNCWAVDKALELGERLGIYHTLTLTNQTNFRRNNGGWDVNVYNVNNGGFLETPGEYFTNERAQQTFEHILRYAVARWGYSTALFSWGLWNEVSATEGFEENAAARWHQRMGRYLQSVDAVHHVVHTNFGNINGNAVIDDLPEMEMVSTNVYAVKDIAHISEDWTKRLIAKFGKPYMLSEYGIGHSMGEGGYAAHDPDRIMAHNGLWSPFMNGSAGTGMAWDWNWLDNEHFYRYIGAVSKFVNGIPFSHRDWNPIQIESLTYTNNARQPSYANALIEGFPGNYAFPPEALEYGPFTVLENGRLDRQDLLHAVLGERRAWRRDAVSFDVEYPVDGRFIVYIPELRGEEPTPQLTVSVDGAITLQKELLPYVAPEAYNPRAYYGSYSIDIVAGAHRVRVANTGGGSIVTAFQLINYVSHTGPNLEVRGMQTDDYVLIWLKHPEFNWMFNRMGMQPQQQAEGRLSLRNVSDGNWLVEWLDTVSGKWLHRQAVNSVNGKLVLETPPVHRSVAARLVRLDK
jgi:hypothetical protein